MVLQSRSEPEAAFPQQTGEPVQLGVEGLPYVDLPPLRPTVRERIREAWASRDLYPGTLRSSIPTFRSSLLGRAWLFLVPVMQIFSFAAILGGVFHAQAPNGVPYVLFIIFSMQAFRIFQMTLMYTTVGAKMHKSRTRALRFPLLLIPFASLSRALVVLGVYWAIAAVALLYYLVADGTLYLQMNFKPLIGFAGLVLLMAFAVAIGLVTSVAYMRARDVRYLVRYLLQLWLFFTPVLYSIQALPHPYQVIVQINPLTPLVGMVQYGFLNAAGDPGLYAVPWSIFAIFCTAAFGLWFFNRFANRWLGGYQFFGEDEDDEGDLL